MSGSARRSRHCEASGAAMGREEGGAAGESRALSTTAVRISQRQEEIATRARMAPGLAHDAVKDSRAEGGKSSLGTPPFPQPCSSLDPKEPPTAHVPTQKLESGRDAREGHPTLCLVLLSDCTPLYYLEMPKQVALQTWTMRHDVLLAGKWSRTHEAAAPVDTQYLVPPTVSIWPCFSTPRFPTVNKLARQLTTPCDQIG